MEKHLDRVMDDVLSNPGVTACVFADHQGLCLGARGKASTECAGMVGAIADQAAKLEPQHKSPIIIFENDTRACIIQRNGTITGAIFKNI
ncbi:ragulator complex protein LAMTOR5 [Photinus pyralis]|uniref:ragulator complex protein LAMTOR5 n=1 Tax=Photinus pyralis TaxID=7054 RepID=UPI0012671108|nr:ragulator complex protein LAMTOR5 [Photinus pyralis]